MCPRLRAVARTVFIILCERPAVARTVFAKLFKHLAVAHPVFTVLFEIVFEHINLRATGCKLQEADRY